MDYAGMQIEILELFAEAQHRAPPRKLCMWRADVHRTKRRGYVLDHELRLLLKLRKGVRSNRCPACGVFAEQRSGCKTLSRHMTPVGVWCTGGGGKNDEAREARRAYKRDWMRAKRAAG